MTEPTKHRRRAEPKRAARAGRAPRPRGARVRPTEELTWSRRIPGLVAFVVVVIALALGVRALASDEQDQPAPRSAAPGAVNATYGNQWTTVDGSTYEISVEPLSDLVQGQSGSGCLSVPPAGSANLHFRILITNKSAADADVPRVDFGTDLVRGSVDPDRQTFAKSNKTLAVDRPAAGAQTCKQAARLGPEGRDKIPAGGVAEFTGTFGPITLPAAVVPTVVYRYYVDDGGKPQATDLLAPFTRF